MTRGGQKKMRTASERRCIASGESSEKRALIRFVLGPEKVVIPDLAEKLPGRGVWVGANRDLLEQAAARNLFARGLKSSVKVPEDLGRQVEQLLVSRLVEAIALCRKAGIAVCGFEKSQARLRAGGIGALLAARDGAEGGKAKLRPLAGMAGIVDCLDQDELGLAFGREFVIHAVLDKGGVTERVLREARRLEGFRPSEADNI